MSSLLLLLVLASHGSAQTSVSGDQTITGATGIGTATPRARVEVVISSADAYGLRVSSPNGSALLVVDKTGKVGIGTESPAALLDVPGRGDDGDIGLQLRAGNSSSTYSSSQIVFAYDSSGTYRHSIRSRAAGGQYFGNALDFFLWRATGSPLSLGDAHVLSIQSSPSPSSATVHVRVSSGIPVYELVVSDGYTLGAGRVQAANVSTPSSREMKEIEREMSEWDARQAYEDVKALRAASFSYRRPGGQRGPLVRGLIYEDAPASIRDPMGESIVLEARLANLEMALKTARSRITALRKKIAERGGGR